MLLLFVNVMFFSNRCYLFYPWGEGLRRFCHFAIRLRVLSEDVLDSDSQTEIVRGSRKKYRYLYHLNPQEKTNNIQLRKLLTEIIVYIYILHAVV